MPLRVRAALLLAFLLCAHGAASQSPARDNPARPRGGTARISGRVVTDAGTPVRRSLVRLSPSEGGESRTALTAADGSYEFRDVPAGAYRLSAGKDAYLGGVFGTDLRYPRGRTFRVAAGEAARNMNVTISRACAISGRVYDESGDGVAYADVNVLRYDPPGSRHQMVTARREGRTDDLGQYRVFGLDPGDYYIQVFPKQSADVTEPAAGRGGLAPTFYPGTADPGQAQAVRVARGQDATGIDFMLVEGGTARVSGVVFDADGRRTAAGLYVEPQVMIPGASTIASATAGDDGTFVLGPLPPASYVIVAFHRPANAREPDEVELGTARLSASGADVDGITIQLNAGSSLSGHVVFDGPARLPSFDRVSIDSAPVDPADPSSKVMRPREVRGDGTFDLRALFGQRLITATVPAGWAVKSIYAGGRDVTDTPITFDRGESITGAQVLLTNRLTRLVVSASDETGKSIDSFYVLVAADDPARWASFLRGRYVRGVSSANGEPVAIEGLPPGDYFAVPFDGEQNLADLAAPDVLNQLRPLGQRFSLKEGETKQMGVRVGRQE